MIDEDLLSAFEHRTLPFEQWTHRVHVRIGWIYLRRHRFDEALQRMRAGIKAYNGANHVPEGPTMGYNETTTTAFMCLIAATMQAYEQSHPVDDSEAFCEIHPQLMQKHVLRLFYSPQRRLHPEAKVRFIEPDLAPLPWFDA